jgi:hypothetical protein
MISTVLSVDPSCIYNVVNAKDLFLLNWTFVGDLKVETMPVSLSPGRCTRFYQTLSNSAPKIIKARPFPTTFFYLFYL